MNVPIVDRLALSGAIRKEEEDLQAKEDLQALMEEVPLGAPTSGGPDLPVREGWYVSSADLPWASRDD